MSSTSGVEGILLRPFDAIKPVPALIFGLCVIGGTAVLAARTGLQTGSVIDLQFGPGGHWLVLLGHGLINWLSLGLALLLVGRWLAPQPFAAWHLLAFQAAARWPLLLSALYLSIPALGEQIRSLTERLTSVMPSDRSQIMADAMHMADAFILTLLGVPLLVFLLWMVWLMYHGYQTATGLRGPQAVFSFAGALVLAWILSRLLNLLLS